MTEQVAPLERTTSESIRKLLTYFDQLPAFAETMAEIEAREGAIALGIERNGRPPFISALAKETNRPIVLISARIEAVPIWQQELTSWLGDTRPILRFAEPTPLPYDRAPWSETARQARLSVMTQLMGGQHPLIPAVDPAPIIVTSARALLQRTLPKRTFLKQTRALRLGQLLDWKKVEALWLDVGYERVTVVERPGQYSQRGGIVDIFPSGGSDYPTRIELFGDEIDTLRYFDPETQRTVIPEGVEPPKRVLIPPAREAIPADFASVGEALAEYAPPKPDNLPAWQDDIEPLQNGEPMTHAEFYLPLLYPKADSLLNYLPKGTQLLVEDWLDLADTTAELHVQAQKLEGEQLSLPTGYVNPLFAWDEIEVGLRDHNAITLGQMEPVDEGESPLPASSLAAAFQAGPRYGGQTGPFLFQLRYAAEHGEDVIVVSRQAERLESLWKADQRRGDFLGPEEDPIVFVNQTLSEGFVLNDHENDKILVNLLTDAEIFGWNRPAPRRYARKRTVAPETYFADLTAGNYIVHSEYGVGKFRGLVVRSIGGADREYLQIEYNNSDMLYVPVHHADRMSKWIGSEDFAPRLNRLGDKQWTTAKKKAQRDIDHLADELLELYAARELIQGHAFGEDTSLQYELEASFPFQETEDQLQAISDVKNDMERVQPMDRLICGDVGFGKTEVALRAAFKTVNEGKQVAVLVPTTVLAQQHYHRFSDRLSAFPVKVAQLSRFVTASQQERTVKEIREGTADIVIGTHRLLSKDVSFRDLGLLIIDEEQRFGVAHKERLKQMRTEVDVLTMTATPIPRTLHMAMSGLRDISVISTPPSDRLPVETYVGEVDETLIRKAILREIDRGGQVYFVHNRVQTIATVMKRLQDLVPEASFALGHGQMGERELESVMLTFSAGEVDVLVATTIIESGLDIPNANTIIIDRADMFGLSQMYQLRGRVGRSVNRAYAYFFHAPWTKLTPEAKARLEAIDEATELGAGYTIAMRDLEIRGAGDLLGGSQSGHIAAIGFDLYTRMLAKAIQVRKAAKEGQVIEMELPDTTLIDLPLPTYIPTDYVPDAALRLRLYRRMAVLTSLEEIDGMSAELADRFGPIPGSIENLLYQLRIKILALRAGVVSVTTESKQIKLTLPDIHHINRVKLQAVCGRDARVSRTGIWLSYERPTREWQVSLVQVLERVEKFRTG